MTTANLNGLSERIESRRQVKQLSLSALSACTGIADKTLRRRIADPGKFTMAELASIARVLDTDLESLIAPKIAA